MDRKSCWFMILCLIMMAIMGLVGLIHFKKELINTLTNEVEFSEAEVRERDLDVDSYSLAVESSQKEFSNADKEVKELQDEVGKLNAAKEEKDKELQACQDSTAALNNEVAAVEKEKSDIEGVKTKWSEEMNGLKQKLQDQSPVCAFVNITNALQKEPSIKDLCPQIRNTVEVKA